MAAVLAEYPSRHATHGGRSVLPTLGVSGCPLDQSVGALFPHRLEDILFLEPLRGHATRSTVRNRMHTLVVTPPSQCANPVGSHSQIRLVWGHLARDLAEVKK